MLDYNARYYDSALGRFISPDSIVPDFSNPQDLNRYSYVRNNPVRFTDPTGHYTFEEGPDDIWNYDSGTPEVIQSAYPGEDVSAYGPVTLGEVLLPAVALYGTGALFSIGVPAVAEAGWTGVTAGWTYVAEATGLACTDRVCTNEAQAGLKAVNTGVNIVYRSVQNGVTRYVGITNNFARRAGEHLSNSQRPLDIRPIRGLENLSRYDARAVEQVLIEHYQMVKNGGTLLNKINSIAQINPIYQNSIQRGNEILQQIGFFD